PSQSLIPPSGNVAPKGPLLQSLPATPNPGAQAHAAPSAPSIPPGQGVLALSARFGHDLPAINGGLHWRGYLPQPHRLPRPLQQETGDPPALPLALRA